MCETVCSFHHSGQTSRHKSRIKVFHQYETGTDGPTVCQQCKERYCLDCKENAIRIGSLGQVIVSHTVCTLCEKCIKSCPIGAIERFEDIIYVCDLCGGSPKCVEACTEGAIEFIADKTETVSLKEMKEKTKKMNCSEKRVAFLNYLK